MQKLRTVKRSYTSISYVLVAQSTKYVLFILAGWYGKLILFNAYIFVSFQN